VVLRVTAGLFSPTGSESLHTGFRVDSCSSPVDGGQRVAVRQVDRKS